MSAPRELWLLGPDDTPPTWTADEMCIDYTGNGIRYLRAYLVDDLIAAGDAMRGGAWTSQQDKWDRALAALTDHPAVPYNDGAR
jgi:hypothetical protein